MSIFSKNISNEKESFQINCQKTQTTNTNDTGRYDLFGNEIKIPCLGSDNGIYDGKYFLCQFITKFPIMNNGLVLSFYKILS